MKTLSEDAVAMLQSARPIIAGAVQFSFSDTYRFWSGYGDLPLGGGGAPYKGIGAKALISPISSRIGGAADGLSINLSALDPDVAQAIELEDYHQKPVLIYRLVFAADGHTLLAAPVFLRGRVDIIPIGEVVGGEASLDIAIEGPRRDMDRAGSRIRSDSDQRVLGGQADGAFRHVGVVGRKTLSWGQKPATAGSSGGVSSPVGRGGTGLIMNMRFQ